MVPIFQTRLGFTRGNCWGACAASITGIPLGEFDSVMSADDSLWCERANAVLKPYGLSYIDMEYEKFPFLENHDGCYCIITGKSPLATSDRHLHSVVGRIDRVRRDRVRVSFVHDPIPGGEFIAGSLPIYVGVFLFRGD